MENSFANDDLVVVHVGYTHIDGTQYLGIYGKATLIQLHDGNTTPFIRIIGNVYHEDLVINIMAAAVYGITKVINPEIITSSKILKLQIDE